MQKFAVVAVTGSLVVGAFLAGVAVGKAPPPQPKFVAAEEVKWDELGGLKLAALFGDYTKGAHGALLKVPAGHTSSLHAHTGGYEAVEIVGTSSHWMKGEDGTKAKKMTPGSYWTIPAKQEHVSSCAPGADCLIYRWQKTKYDVLPPKEDKGASKSASAGAGAAGSASVKAGAALGTGSAATKATGATAGSASVPATAPKSGAGSAAPVAPKK